MSETLTDVAGRLPPGTISVERLLEELGEQGLLLGCLVVSLPYLIPVSIPVASTLSGIVIILLAFGDATNTVPWLPRWVLQRTFASASLVHVLSWGARHFRRIEHVVRPRLPWLTQGRAADLVNGGVLMASGAALLLPLPFFPLTNTLPGVAVIVLSGGVLQRDGLLIVAGYVLTLATFIYFALIAWAVWFGATWVRAWFAWGSA